MLSISPQSDRQVWFCVCVCMCVCLFKYSIHTHAQFRLNQPTKCIPEANGVLETFRKALVSVRQSVAVRETVLLDAGGPWTNPSHRAATNRKLSVYILLC